MRQTATQTARYINRKINDLNRRYIFTTVNDLNNFTGSPFEPGTNPYHLKIERKSRIRLTPGKYFVVTTGRDIDRYKIGEDSRIIVRAVYGTDRKRFFLFDYIDRDQTRRLYFTFEELKSIQLIHEIHATGYKL